jgi:hypothetical protein
MREPNRMKKSSAVTLVLLTSSAISLETCGNDSRRCVDSNNFVVDNQPCENSPRYRGGVGYQTYYGGNGGVGARAAGGSFATSSGTVSGVFGGAGEAAGGGAHGGAGGGE